MPHNPPSHAVLEDLSAFREELRAAVGVILADLPAYRASHLRHHLQLGTEGDPDRLHRPPAGSWQRHYLRHLLSLRTWWGSLAGHLGDRGVDGLAKLYILGWWALVCTTVVALAGESAAAVLIGLCLLSRATAFHAITVFREMCDHYGLPQGGVIRYTRDICRNGIWRQLVHPRNNGCHLTHHLLPAVPYYRLPEAQQMFARTPTYRERCHVCDSYVLGHTPAVSRWSSGD